MGSKRFLWPIGALVCWVGLTWVSEYFDLDRRLVSAFFYQPDQGFFQGQRPLYLWLYKEGTYLGPILTLTAAIAWVGGYFKGFLYKVQRQWLVVLLTALVGGGILVNGLLKDYWGRPRPREVVTYGGLWPYHNISELGTPGKGKSFPCGHCTSAFLLVSTWVFIPTNPLLGTLGLAAGLGYGLIMSMARVAQGAHFPTDAFWALGVVVQVSLFFYLVLCRGERKKSINVVSAKKRLALVAGLVFFTLGVATAFMSRRPYFKSYLVTLPMKKTPRSIELRFNQEPSRFQVIYQEVKDPELKVDVQGLGWTQATHRLLTSQVRKKQTQKIWVRFRSIGYFSEISQRVRLILPLKFRLSVKVQTKVEPEKSQ